MQVGRAGQTGGSNSPTLLGRPAHMEIDAATNELYIADGYGNKRADRARRGERRVKRHWAPTARRPATRSSPCTTRSRRKFANPVHCVRPLERRPVYVCDRAKTTACRCSEGRNLRQTVHVRGEIARLGLLLDLVFSNDAQQKYFYLADGTNDQVLTVER